MIYDLPTSVNVGGKEYEIRSDFRPMLDILTAIKDPELSDQERTFIILLIFYPDANDIPVKDYEEAIQKCFWFLKGDAPDSDDRSKSLHLMDWEQDFRLIVAPVNRVIGQEIRQMPYLHWWSFLSAYMEIGGDCTFAQVVSIRNKKARGKALDKPEREWARQNRALIEIKTKYTQAEDNLTKEWT